MLNLTPECPICHGEVSLFDVVDFNKNCEENRGKFLPLAGVPIYYSRCQNCSFTFAPEFSNWSEQDFFEKIYNDQYVDIDPDYLETRPTSNAQGLKDIFKDKQQFIRHLDYGGGNGRMSQILAADGWLSETYDPFPATDVKLKDLGKFNLITSLEVFEHVPDANALMQNLTQALSDDGLILFSTLISDNDLKLNQRMSWWYAAPRNGHISLYSRESLFRLGLKYGLKFASFSDGFHAYYKTIPSWASHIIREG